MKSARLVDRISQQRREVHRNARIGPHVQVRIRAKKKTKGWRTISGLNDCCEIRAGVPERQRRVLQTVLAVNVALFVTEVGAGLLARSTALLADCGHARRCDRVRFQSVCRRAWSSLAGPRCTAEGRDCAVPSLKGTLWPPWALSRLPPIRSAMVAVAAPIGRLLRNDVVANSAVLLAAGVVLITRSPWPDIAVGLMIAALFGVRRSRWCEGLSWNYVAGQPPTRRILPYLCRTFCRNGGRPAPSSVDFTDVTLGKWRKV
jgi:hypothetical protein